MTDECTRGLPSSSSVQMSLFSHSHFFFSFLLENVDLREYSRNHFSCNHLNTTTTPSFSPPGTFTYPRHETTITKSQAPNPKLPSSVVCARARARARSSGSRLLRRYWSLITGHWSLLPAPPSRPTPRVRIAVGKARGFENTSPLSIIYTIWRTFCSNIFQIFNKNLSPRAP